VQLVFWIALIVEVCVAIESLGKFLRRAGRVQNVPWVFRTVERAGKAEREGLIRNRDFDVISLTYILKVLL
jgi:hypothetical protein